MSTYNIQNKIQIWPKGTWNNSTQYKELDLVWYEPQKRSYLAAKDNINIVCTNTEYWIPVGSDLITGIRGPSGDRAPYRKEKQIVYFICAVYYNSRAVTFMLSFPRIGWAEEILNSNPLLINGHTDWMEGTRVFINFIKKYISMGGFPNNNMFLYPMCNQTSPFDNQSLNNLYMTITNNDDDHSIHVKIIAPYYSGARMLFTRTLRDIDLTTNTDSNAFHVLDYGIC